MEHFYQNSIKVLENVEEILILWLYFDSTTRISWKKVLESTQFTHCCAPGNITEIKELSFAALNKLGNCAIAIDCTKNLSCS